MKLSDGMFLEACRAVSKEYPDIKYDEDLLDRVCLRIVQNPAPYADRVMVMPNLYGDILSGLFSYVHCQLNLLILLLYGQIFALVSSED